MLAGAIAGCTVPDRIEYQSLAEAAAATETGTPPPAAPAILPRPAAAATATDAGEPAATLEIALPDGARLPLREWLPAGAPRAVVLALHGFNDYSNAFAMPGAALAWRGIASYAYDQRGFGLAPGRGSWPGRWLLASDAATAARLLRARHPGVPLYCLGESMGGAVLATALALPAGEAPPCDGAILVAPAVWGWETMGLAERTLLAAAVRVVPGLTLSGGGVVRVRPSDNVAMLRRFNADPLVIKGTRVDAVWGLVNLMQAALDAAPEIRTPLLYLYGERDELVPKAPTRLMLRRLARSEDAASLSVAAYPNGYHMLLRDLGGAMPTADIAAWIAAKGRPLPSGADRYAAAVLFPGSRDAGGENAAAAAEPAPRPALARRAGAAGETDAPEIGFAIGRSLR